MIKKRPLNNGVNANVSLEPAAAAQSNNNINNNIFINKRDMVKKISLSHVMFNLIHHMIVLMLMLRYSYLKRMLRYYLTMTRH